MQGNHIGPARPLTLSVPRLAAIGAITLVAGLSHVGASAQAPKLEDSVIFAMPGGAPQDVVQKCIVTEFTKKTNVRVDFVSLQPPQALARILAQRASPTIDVVYTITQTDYTGFKEGVFLPLNDALVPNLANIEPKFAEPGRGAVLMAALLGIQYNTAVFKEKGWAPPKSWHDLWDPKYRGHVGIPGLGLGTGQALISVAAFLNGGNAKNFDAAFANLAKLKPNLYAIFQQAPQYDNAVLDGNVWLGVSNSGRPLGMMQQGSPVSFVQPAEGVVLSNVGLSVVKGAPHPAAALAFVNWMLSKEAQACLPAAGYTPVVKGVQIPPEMLPFMTVQREAISVDWLHLQDSLPDLLKRWNKELDG